MTKLLLLDLDGSNYLDAETWRKRFLPGMHQFNNITPAQLRFLEGVEL